jgi:hypothetical protein
MDHAYHRCKDHPESYDLTLFGLGPTGLPRSSRVDGTTDSLCTYAQPAFLTTHESHSPLPPDALDTRRGRKAYTASPASKTKVSCSVRRLSVGTTWITLRRQETVLTKRWSVLSACTHCRRRKTKCSGQRPVCQFCKERGLTCEWNIPGGLTRTEDLRRRLEDAERYCQEAYLLIEALQSGSIETATMLLAKLRFGVSLSDLAEAIRSGTVHEHDLPRPVESERY